MRRWIATRISYRYKTLSSAKEELVNNFMKILNSNLDVWYKKRGDVYNFAEIQHKFYVTY